MGICTNQPWAIAANASKQGPGDLPDGPLPVETIAEERQTIHTQVGQILLPFESKAKAQAFLLLPDGHTYQLNKGTTLIGRDNSNDFVFLNKFVSRRHVKIVEEGKNLFRVFDLGTPGGTWLKWPPDETVRLVGK